MNIFFVLWENKSLGFNICLIVFVILYDLGLCGEFENSMVGLIFVISVIL